MTFFGKINWVIRNWNDLPILTSLYVSKVIPNNKSLKELLGNPYDVLDKNNRISIFPIHAEDGFNNDLFDLQIVSVISQNDLQYIWLCAEQNGIIHFPINQILYPQKNR